MSRLGPSPAYTRTISSKYSTKMKVKVKTLFNLKLTHKNLLKNFKFYNPVFLHNHVQMRIAPGRGKRWDNHTACQTCQQGCKTDNVITHRALKSPFIAVENCSKSCVNDNSSHTEIFLWRINTWMLNDPE